MMPLALDLISTLVTGSILPVATTERARSMRSAFTSFSGSILGEPRPIAFRVNSAAPPSRGTRRNKIHFSDRFLREVAILRAYRGYEQVRAIVPFSLARAGACRSAYITRTSAADPRRGPD